MHKTTRGFTIVELLIVIVVIGILAAIVIVAFNGIQTRANTTSVRSDLAAFSKKAELFKIDSPTGTYPATQTDLESLNMKLSKGGYMTSSASSINLLYCHSASYANYALLAMTKDGKKLYISNIVAGPQEYTDANTWNDADYPARCRTVLPNSSNTAQAGIGSGAWRAWTGVAN